MLILIIESKLKIGFNCEIVIKTQIELSFTMKTISNYKSMPDSNGPLCICIAFERGTHFRNKGDVEFDLKN